MESFIGIAGGLGILLILGICAAFVAFLIFKLKPGKRSGPSVTRGIRNCPICGSPMESLTGSPHIIRCTNYKCPNYQDTL